GVLDFLTVIKAHAGDDAIGNVGAQHLLFQDPALGVGAIKDGHLIPIERTFAAQPAKLAGHPSPLVVLVTGAVETDLLPLGPLGEEILGDATGVHGDDRVGGVQDGLGGAKVL